MFWNDILWIYKSTSRRNNENKNIIRVGKVVFKKGNRLIQQNNPDLWSSDLVRIIFVLRNNDKWNICIHIYKSGDIDLCPVISWVTKVQIVHIIPESSNESEICLFYDDKKKTSLVRAYHVQSKIWAIVVLIREDVLGYNKDDIGLSSIWVGGAMEMLLSGTSVVIIIRVGRWLSEAFL